MILTDKDLRAVQQVLDEVSGLDPELVDSCRPLLRSGAVDDAVRSACVILENRLRQALGGVPGTGVELAQRAFGVPNGELTRRIRLGTAEKEGFRDLFVGAFKLFRNPVAHGKPAYPTEKARAIISHVNLLLLLLGEIPATFAELPQNVLDALLFVSTEAGQEAALRLESFLRDCITIGLQPYTKAKDWIPFRTRCLRGSHSNPTPKSRNIAVFYLLAVHFPRIRFDVNGQYSYVVGFDTSGLKDRLHELGFRPAGANQEPHADLRRHNTQEFFSNLFQVVDLTVNMLAATLDQR